MIDSLAKGIFDILFSYLKAPCDSIYVAGGAVVDIQKASDIDLWFGKEQHTHVHMFLNNCPYWHFVSNAKVGYELVGEVFIPAVGKLIQVMVTKDMAMERMQKFDISTHCWAYTSRGKLIRGEKATEWFEPPIVWRANTKTLARYMKICQRYGSPVNLEVIKQLCGGAVESKKAENITGPIYGEPGQHITWVPTKWIDTNTIVDKYPSPNAKITNIADDDNPF